MLNVRRDSTEGETVTREHLAPIPLVSLLLFLVIGAFVTLDRKGEVSLDISLCVALAAATVELSARRTMPWPRIFWASATALFFA